MNATEAPGRQRFAAFTLLELLVVIAIIAVLASLITAVVSRSKESSHRAACLSNLRQMGVAVNLFTGDNNFELPGRTSGNGTARWPAVLAPYIGDSRVYAAPGDPENWILQKKDPLSNSQNNTSFIMNGYNDLLDPAAGGNLTFGAIRVRTTMIERPSEVILFGMPRADSDHFYMDFLEGPNGNQVDVLNTKAYTTGSCYLFADGSARFLKAEEHNVRLWLVNKEFALP